MLSRCIPTIPGFSDQEKSEVQSLKEKLHGLTDDEVSELYARFAAKYPKMRKWKLPEKRIPGSRRAICDLCHKETVGIMVFDSDYFELNIGFFCPECDEALIGDYLRKGAKRVDKPGYGSSIPWDSMGFTERPHPYRSRGERDVGARSGKGEDLIASRMMKTATIERDPKMWKVLVSAEQALKRVRKHKRQRKGPK